MPFWQVFRFKPTHPMGTIRQVPGEPPPAQQLMRMMMSNPGTIRTTMSHCRSFDTAEAAAENILTYPYVDADAYVVEADSSKGSHRVLEADTPGRVTWIGRSPKESPSSPPERQE